MAAFHDERLEEQIAQWRAYVSRRQSVQEAGIEELEGRLRDELMELIRAGLAVDEAFLVALKRVGSADAASGAFARTHSARLWKEWTAATGERAESARTEMFVALGLAVAAALAVKAPELFGIRISGAGERFYARNAALLVLPLLSLFFLWKRGTSVITGLWLALPFAAGAVFANVYPFRAGGDTEVLTTLHLPVALWLVVGFAYVGARWFGNSGRMDFVRFSGELAIHYVLIALGGGVLTVMTVMLFKAIGVNPKLFVEDWLVPCGAAGAVIVASWLVEAKQSVVENIAPLLTKIFTPLFTLLLLVFLTTMAWTGSPIKVEREMLIVLDLLLVLVVGLVLYAISARDPEAPPGFFDGLQLLLVVSALAVDGAALVAVAARISGFGFTPNRVAALGENLILLVNLAGSAWLYARILLRKVSFAALERWQVAYLPVYFAWAALVVVLFPPLFGYR